MAALTAFLLLAAAQPAAPTADRPQFEAKTGVSATSQVSVRILSGARVTLGLSADSGNYHVTAASVRLEDGTRRSAQLVEFQ